MSSETEKRASFVTGFHERRSHRLKKHTEAARARWYHKLDTPQGIKTVVRNAVELVPPTAFMIIHHNARFVNS